MDNSNIIISVIIVLCIAAGVTAYGISEGDNAVFSDLAGFTPDSSNSGDNGLGNIMIDYCSKKYFGKDYDKDGEYASKGKINDEFLNFLLKDDYYILPPPKTTGREYFSSKYIEKKLEKAPENKYDIISTVTALTAKNIAQTNCRIKRSMDWKKPALLSLIMCFIIVLEIVFMKKY